MRPLLLSTAAVFALPISSNASEPAAGKQVEASFETSAGAKMPHLLYLPKDHSAAAAREWPVILFLHGRGESRGPLGIVAKWGPPRMAARGDDLKYIVISPQCPADRRWTSPDQISGVLELLDHIVATHSGDESRIYLTGLSMGGFGSWTLAADHGERFAAVAPICGAGDPADGIKLKDIPIWAFHGTEDKAVPYQRSVEMVGAAKKAGNTEVRFTTLDHVGHNSWSAAYATPELFSWFDGHRRRS